MNRFARYVAPVALLAGSVSAFAADPADPLAALATISSTNGGFGPVMFGLAITGVAVMVGVKWIKRGKSAA